MKHDNATSLPQPNYFYLVDVAVEGGGGFGTDVPVWSC